LPDRSVIGTPKPIMPQRRARRGMGSAGEGAKQEVFRRVRDVADDLGRLVPACDCGRFFCPWDGLRKRLESVVRAREDLKRLQALSRGGKPIPRALAASLAMVEKGEMKGMAQFPMGDRAYHYAPVPGVPPKALLGVQNARIPGLRLMALSLVSGRKRYVVYAWEEGTAARRPGEPAPEGFVADLSRGLRYELRKGKGGWACAHAADTPHLALRLPGGAAVRVCVRCARDNENVAVHVGNRVLPPAGQRPLEPLFFPRLQCTEKECSIPESWELDKARGEAYARGEVSDRAVATRELGRLAERIEARKVFTAAGRCYEDDAKAFVAALAGTAAERKALLAVLPKAGGVQLAEATAAKLLEVLWPKHGRAALSAVAGKEEADRLLAAMPKATPQQIVSAADQGRRSSEILAKLPSLGKLPPLAALVDSAVRAHRTGDEGAVRILEAGKDHRTKAVRWGFLLALGREKGAEWQFTTEERELGAFLRDKVPPLLQAEGDAYRASLQEILTLSGSGESLP